MKRESLLVGCFALVCLACPGRPAQDPKEAEALARYLTGIGHLQEAQFGDAVLELNASLAIDPSRAQAHHSLGEAYIGVVRAVDAEASFRQALLLEPDKYLSHLGLGHALHLQGRYAEAIGAFRAAARLRPNLPEPHVFIAEVLQRAGEQAAAAEAYAEAARLTAPEDRARPLAKNARALASAGRHEEAQEIFEAVVKMVPEDVEAWLGLAEARVRTRALREAAEAYEIAARLDPADVITLQLLATVHEVLGEDELAVSVYERALTTAPESSRIWEGLARLHLSKGRREAALQAAEQGLAHLGGDDTKLIRSVADLLAELGDATRSSELYRLLLLESDDDPSLWGALARQLLVLGREQDVRNICDRIRDLSGRNGEHAAHLEWCQAGLFARSQD